MSETRNTQSEIDHLVGESEKLTNKLYELLGNEEAGVAILTSDLSSLLSILIEKGVIDNLSWGRAALKNREKLLSAVSNITAL